MTKDDYIEYITQQYIDLLGWVQENLSKSTDDEKPVLTYSPQREQKIVYGAGTGMPYYVNATPKASEELSCYIKSGKGFSLLESVLNEK